MIEKIHYIMGQYKIDLKAMCLSKKPMQVITSHSNALSHKFKKIMDDNNWMLKE